MTQISLQEINNDLEGLVKMSFINVATNTYGLETTMSVDKVFSFSLGAPHIDILLNDPYEKEEWKNKYFEGQKKAIKWILDSEEWKDFGIIWIIDVSIINILASFDNTIINEYSRRYQDRFKYIHYELDESIRILNSFDLKVILEEKLGQQLSPEDHAKYQLQYQYVSTYSNFDNSVIIPYKGDPDYIFQLMRIIPGKIEGINCVLLRDAHSTMPSKFNTYELDLTKNWLAANQTNYLFYNGMNYFAAHNSGGKSVLFGAWNMRKASPELWGEFKNMLIKAKNVNKINFNYEKDFCSNNDVCFFDMFGYGLDERLFLKIYDSIPIETISTWPVTHLFPFFLRILPQKFYKGITWFLQYTKNNNYKGHRSGCDVLMINEQLRIELGQEPTFTQLFTKMDEKRSVNKYLPPKMDHIWDFLWDYPVGVDSQTMTLSEYVNSSPFFTSLDMNEFRGNIPGATLYEVLLEQCNFTKTNNLFQTDNFETFMKTNLKFKSPPRRRRSRSKSPPRHRRSRSKSPPRRRRSRSKSPPRRRRSPPRRSPRRIR